MWKELVKQNLLLDSTRVNNKAVETRKQLVADERVLQINEHIPKIERYTHSCSGIYKPQRNITIQELKNSRRRSIKFLDISLEMFVMTRTFKLDRFSTLFWIILISNFFDKLTTRINKKIGKGSSNELNCWKGECVKVTSQKKGVVVYRRKGEMIVQIR